MRGNVHFGSRIAAFNGKRNIGCKRNGAHKRAFYGNGISRNRVIGIFYEFFAAVLYAQVVVLQVFHVERNIGV